MEFEHQIALSEINIPKEKLPKGLKASIQMLNRQIAAADVSNAAEMQILKNRSVALADEIQSTSEQINNLTENTMLQNEELTRALAVGLDENATIEQVIALENEAKEKAEIAAGLSEQAKLAAEAKDKEAKDKADKDAADADAKTKADKDAADKAAADKAAKDKADKDAADAEEDDFFGIDI